MADTWPAVRTRDLFEQARRGGPEDLNAFYERCARKLMPLIRLRLGRTLRRDVESRDILQSVLCKSVGRLDAVKDPGAVMGWLARMAENEIRDLADFHQRQMRDSARRSPIEDAADVPAPVRQALSRVILSEEAARIESALESLTPAQRDLIVLRKLEELTFPEIAKKLASTEDAVRVAFSRAMAALLMKLGSGGLPRTDDEKRR
jgi:RNA polymerase sigma-70 factor (ECF subfamily)